MLDPIERAKQRCEDWADENIQGDKFKCPGVGHGHF